MPPLLVLDHILSFFELLKVIDYVIGHNKYPLLPLITLHEERLLPQRQSQECVSFIFCVFGMFATPTHVLDFFSQLYSVIGVLNSPKGT